MPFEQYIILKLKTWSLTLNKCFGIFEIIFIQWYNNNDTMFQMAVLKQKDFFSVGIHLMVNIMLYFEKMILRRTSYIAHQYRLANNT